MVFKRKRYCFVPDTATVHTTTPKTISENGSIPDHSTVGISKMGGQTSFLIAVIFSLFDALASAFNRVDFSRRAGIRYWLLSLPNELQRSEATLICPKESKVMEEEWREIIREYKV